MSFLDVAQQTYDFLRNQQRDAATFGNQFNENFLGQSRIPEELSQTRLNDLTNRFNIADRLATWEDDLAASSAESQYQNWFNNYRLSEFDDITRQESLNRDLEIMNTRANIDNFESQQKLAQLQNEQAQLEAEANIDKLTYDRMYDELKSTIPDYVTMTPSERYEKLKQAAVDTNAPDRVVARIKREYLQQSQDQLNAVRNMAALVQQRTQLERLISQTGEAPTSTMVNAWNNLSNQIAGFQVQITDPAIIRNAVDLGIITVSQAGSLLNQSRTDLGFSPVDPRNVQDAANNIGGYNYQAPPTPETQSQTTSAPTLGQNTGNIIQPGQPVPMPSQPPVPQIQGNPVTDINAWEGLAQSLPPCATEDSVNCVWRANVQGNGQGTSFIAIGDPDNPQIIRMPQQDAITPPQPQANQFSVPYQESNLVSSALQDGRIVQAIENDPNFPRSLVGVLSKTNYSPSTWMQDRDNLIRLSEQLELMTNPTERRVMQTILEAKLDAFVNMLRQNGIITNG